MRLKLIPCYEGEPYEGDLSPFHPLHGRLDEQQMSAFLMTFSYRDAELGKVRTVAEAVDHLVAASSLTVSGGLVAVKNDYRLFPGCCHGLESWRAWVGTRQGKGPGWMGHDPSAWVDVSGVEAIFHNGTSAPNEALSVRYDEITEAVEQAGRDLEDLMEAMRAWLSRSGIAKVDDVISKLTKELWIGPSAALAAEQVMHDMADILTRLRGQ
jgi:hypothetical protein